MTRYERLSIVVSLVMSSVTIVVTIILAMIFNPVRQELKHMGKVNVEEKFLFENGQKKGYLIELTNPGDKPIDGLSVGIWAKDPKIALPNERSEVIFVPITQFRFERDGQRLYLDTPKVLAKGQKLSIIILGIEFPPGTESHDFRVDVSSAAGDSIIISRSRGGGASGSY